MTRPVTIVLADDHQVVREGLRRLLETVPGFAVVGEAAAGPEVVALVERVKPRVVVVDLMMPGLGGVEVTRQLRERAPDARVIILSMHSAEAFVLEALRAGAAGFVPKDAPGAELIRAVHETAAGRRYLSPPLTDAVIAAYVERTAQGSTDPFDALTAREREVLALAAEGCTSKQIAQRLSISPRTAESHRASLMKKLALKGQTDLVRYALQRGLLPPDSP